MEIVSIHRWLRSAGFGIRKQLMRLVWAATLLTALAPLLAHSAAESTGLENTFPHVRIVDPIDDTRRVILSGNRHPAALQGVDRGRVADNLRLERMILSLKPDQLQTAVLDQFLADTHDPSSPRHGQWMNAQTFAQHFGAAEDDITRVTGWLMANGFAIDEVAPGRLSIVFSGTAAQVRLAFHTEIRRYRFNAGDHIANATEPEIPAALAPVVAGVVSLHDIRSQPMSVRQTASPDYTSGSTHYLAATDFQTIYNLQPLYSGGIDGSGKSIAIIGRSNVVLSDLQQFRTFMNLPANTPLVIVNGSDPGLVTGDQGESDLDLEWAGAVAPGATIKFVTSANTASSDGITLSAQYAVSNNVADVISLSYGQCESSLGPSALNFFNNLWSQAAAQGITVVVSSGDSGAAGCDAASTSSATHGRAVNGLCTSPYSTCVGGTQFADTSNPSLYWATSNNTSNHSSALSYIPEVVWNESGSNGGSGLWSSGGGASTFFSKPSWQTTPGVPADGKRDVPDVALTAATHDGYLVYSSDNTTQTQTLYVFGGTSASAPAFAGIMALINHKTGYRQGNANPRLYGLATRQASGSGSAYFHQITSGNNSVPGLTGFVASTSAPYYNKATGLGSVDGNVLVSHWVDLLPVSTTTLTVSPAPSTVGQSITLTATVTGATPTGTVQFLDNGSNLDAPIVLASGVATLITNTLSSGSHSITASYSGDPSNQPSTSSPWAQTVLNTTTTSISVTPSPLIAGQSVALVAVVTGAAPTGSVQFKDGASNLGSLVTLSSGSATLNTNALVTAGAHNLTALYSGDSSNTSSTSPAIVESVSPANSAITVTASATAITIGQTVTLTAAVSGVAPTGTVQFKDGQTNLGDAVMLNGGAATTSTATLAVGTHSLVATYSGDANNLGSSTPPLTVAVSDNGLIGNADADVPALPQWAGLLLGWLLISSAWRHHNRSCRRLDWGSK